MEGDHITPSVAADGLHLKINLLMAREVNSWLDQKAGR